jgi:hypothetical protein
MRCLYCGKELALLKRWTGGGEFCSDAHRQRYQEEYNQLALNRLLQAKPPTEAKPPLEPQSVPAASPFVPSEPVREAITYSAKATPAAPAPEPPALIPEPEPVATAAFQGVLHEPAPPEVTVPAEIAGFLVERPVVVLTELVEMCRPDMEFIDAVAAALPNHVFEPLTARGDSYQLGTAGLLTFQPSNKASNYSSSGSRDRRLEVRDFVRGAPVVEFDLSPVGETGLETSSEAMDILIFPKPPQGLPLLWQEPPVGFATAATELGALARLPFVSTGFSAQDEPADSASQAGVALANPLPPVEIVETISQELAEEAAPVPEPIIEPAVEAPVEQVVEQAVAPVEASPDPEVVTKPLPLVLHIAAPGKAKPAQVFSSASSAVDVQIPRSTSLPLRPVLVFGPAPVKEAEKPAEKKAPASPKSEPKRPLVAPAPIRPDKRTAAPEPVKQVAKAEAPSTPKPPAKVDAKQDKKHEVKENGKLREDAKLGKAEALAAPYPGSSDLGLPRLNLHASQGFWGNLPAAAKIGIAAALVAALGGLIAFSSKSGGASVTSANTGTVVAGSPLPVGESGWIADWGADPGVRRTRQISILRSSQTVTDYRIELQGQIETKAIGWIFRAADPKNFYVTKLEIMKPGLQPTVALVRFAMINGEEQVRAQLPLPMKVRRDTMYKIRLDAVGNHFVTYVQDQKVDDWTNDSVKTGGVGLYSERGETATLKGGISIVPLIVRK